MANAEAVALISVADYLANEKHAEVGHEYFTGCVVTMEGISRRQTTIAGNLFTAIHGKLHGGPCRPFLGDLKLGIQRNNETLFYYPDIVVECDSTAVEDDSYTTEPKVIIEVLSPTTERIDRQEKFWAYAETASLEDYVLVDHQESAVTVFRKTTDWQSEALSSTANLVLPSIEFQMPVAQVCIDIHFNNLA